MKTRYNKIENKFKLLLAFSIFFSGATSLINEFILSTFSSLILGNAFVMLTLTIGIMLFGTGIGAMTQKYISDKGLMEKFIKLEFTLAMIGAFAPLVIYGLFAVLQYEFNMFLHSVIFLIGFLVGFEIPLLIRVSQKYTTSSISDSMSLMFSADYFGAFIGTLFWVYFLLNAFALTESSFIIAGINLSIASLTFFYYLKHKEYLEDIAYINRKSELKKSIKINKVLGESTLVLEDELANLKKEENSSKKSVFIGIYILSIMVLIGGFMNSSKLVIKFEQKMYADPIVISETTKYQHLIVTENKELNQYDFYINGNIQYSSLDKDRYHELLVHPIMSLTKKKSPKVLVIGGGDGLAVAELKKYKNAKISLVDLDPGMIKLSSTNKILKELNNNAFRELNIIKAGGLSTGELQDIYMKDENERETKEVIDTVNIIHVDASKFMLSLRNQNVKWDVVIIDLPDPSTPDLTKLYSKQFYSSVRNMLSKDGHMVVQSTSPYRAKESFLCIKRTIESAGYKSVLPYHINVPAFGDWGFIIASKKDEDMKKKLRGIENFDINLSYLNKGILRASLEFGVNELKTKDTRINELMRPILLDTYLNNSWLKY